MTPTQQMWVYLNALRIPYFPCHRDSLHSKSLKSFENKGKSEYATLPQAQKINIETEAQLEAERAQREVDYNEYLYAELGIVRKIL